MKQLLALSVLALLASGCMMPNIKPLIDKSKSAHIMIWSPIYGYILVDTRAQGDTRSEPLYALPAPEPTPLLKIIPNTK